MTSSDKLLVAKEELRLIDNQIAKVDEELLRERRLHGSTCKEIALYLKSQSLRSGRNTICAFIVEMQQNHHCFLNAGELSDEEAISDWYNRV